MPHIKIVIDDGSNFIKCVYKIDGKSKVINFPSRVIRRALTTLDGFAPEAYQIGENVYSVSLSGADSIPTNNRDYQLSDANRVLINHAVKLTGAKTCEILLTLPVSQFFNFDGSINNELTDAKRTNALGDIKSKDGAKLAEITKVFVMPEGVPAFSHAKEALKLPDGRYLIADIGGTTTDLVIFDAQSNIEKFVSLNIGALNMMNDFKLRVTGALRLEGMTDQQTYNGLLTGTVAGQDVKEQSTQCINAFEQEISDNIKQLGDLKLFDGVIYSGGGSLLLTSKAGHMTSNPQLDNANGALSAFGG